MKKHRLIALRLASIFALVFLLLLSPGIRTAAAVLDAISAAMPDGGNSIMDGASSINGSVKVNDEIIEAPSVYIRDHEGNVMVPLRAVVEALGMSVEWRVDSWSILIGGNLVLWPDEVRYRVIDTNTSGEFGPAPEIREGRTFVSLPFFNFLLPDCQAKIEDGFVVVDAL